MSEVNKYDYPKNICSKEYLQDARFEDSNTQLYNLNAVKSNKVLKFSKCYTIKAEHQRSTDIQNFW